MNRIATIPCAWVLCLGIAAARANTAAQNNTAAQKPAPEASPQKTAANTGDSQKNPQKSPQKRAGDAKKGKNKVLRVRWRKFDSVLAIFGERIVTSSDVRSKVDSQMDKIIEEMRSRNPNARLPEQYRARYTQGLEWRFAQERVAKLQRLGRISEMPMPEEMVQRVIDEHVQRTIDRDTAEAGSAMALYRNLQAQGRTFREYKADLRDEVTLQLISSQTYTKYMGGGNLKVTPAEMWDYYREHSKDYQREVKAKIEFYRLRLNQDKEAALARITKLRSQLMQGGKREKLARQYKAFYITEELRPDHGRLPVLTDYAFSNSTKKGQWSQPLLSKDHVFIISLISRQKGGLKGFKEAMVQREIRSQILRGRLMELERKLQANHAQSLGIWPPALMTSQAPPARWPR